MFARNLFRRLLCQPIGIYSVHAKNASTSIAFGDFRMPDKLYKSVKLEIKSCERAVIMSYVDFVKTAAKHLEITVGHIHSKRKYNHERYSLLKSAVGKKKHMIQYEIRTYFTWMTFNKLTGSTADTFLEYIERMVPEGVALKVTKEALESIPDHLNPSSIQQL